MKKIISLILINILVPLKGSAQILTGTVSQNIIVNYNFNGNAIDQSGGGYDGTVIGAQLIADRFGEAGKAFYFNGSSNYIISNKNLPDSSSLTISLWIRPDILKLAGLVYDAAFFTPGRDTSFQMLSDGSLRAGFTKIADPGPPSLTTSSVLIPSDWSHVVATVDGTESNIFLNGTKIATQSFAGNNVGYHSRLHIGAENHGVVVEQFFQGAIDDVLIYNRSLTESEVATLHQIQSISSSSLSSIS